MVETVPFEPERYFKSDAARAHLIADALGSGHAGYIVDAIGIAARAYGMSKVAEETGLNRQALYAAFGPKGNPTMDTVVKVLACLGMSLDLKEAA